MIGRFARFRRYTFHSSGQSGPIVPPDVSLLGDVLGVTATVAARQWVSGSR